MMEWSSFQRLLCLSVTCGRGAAKLEEALRRLPVPSGVTLTEALSPVCLPPCGKKMDQLAAKRFAVVRKEGRSRNCGCRGALKALHGRRKAHRWAPQRVSRGQNGHHGAVCPWQLSRNMLASPGRFFLATLVVLCYQYQ